MARRRGGAHLAPGPSRRRRTLTLVLGALGAIVALGAAVLVTGGGDGGGQVEADGPTASTSTVPTSSTSVETTSTTAAPSTTTTTVRGPRGSGEAVTMVFVGDMYAEGALSDRLSTDPDGFVGPFAAVVREADLAVGNLETAVTERGSPPPGRSYTYRAPASVLDALQSGGFDVVSMANNHGIDFGAVGLEDSLAAKRASGAVVGIGADEAEAYAPFSTEIKGQRIAVIGATQVLDSSLVDDWTATGDQAGLASAKRVERLVAEVQTARESHDTVVVFLHWGVSTEECPVPRQLDLAVTLRDAGADVIVGSHANRVQGGGLLGGAAVHYGLGNFLFEAHSADSARSGAFRVTIAGREVESTEWIPGRVDGGVPRPLEGPAAAEELARWESQRGCTNLAAG